MLTQEILQTLDLADLKRVYADALRDVYQVGAQLKNKRQVRVSYLKTITAVIDRKRRS